MRAASTCLNPLPTSDVGPLRLVQRPPIPSPAPRCRSRSALIRPVPGPCSCPRAESVRHLVTTCRAGEGWSNADNNFIGARDPAVIRRRRQRAPQRRHGGGGPRPRADHSPHPRHLAPPADRSAGGEHPRGSRPADWFVRSRRIRRAPAPADTWDTQGRDPYRLPEGERPPPEGTMIANTTTIIVEPGR